MRQLACVIAMICAAVTLASTQPTFSSRVDGVRVDVLVTDSSRRPLRGLTPQDFVIRDNGVLQQVDLVSYGEISLNVGLAFDLSESVDGERLEQLRAASRSLTRSLLPGDQSPLVTFDRVVSLRCPLSADRGWVDQALGNAQPDGETALIDGVFAGMTVGESDAGCAERRLAQTRGPRESLGRQGQSPPRLPRRLTCNGD